MFRSFVVFKNLTLSEMCNFSCLLLFWGYNSGLLYIPGDYTQPHSPPPHPPPPFFPLRSYVALAGWPGTHKDLPVCAFQVLRLNVYTAMPSQPLDF